MNKLSKKLLQQTGLKVTKARILLLETLQEISRPVSIADLQQHPAICRVMNITTLYRSLDKMAEANLIYKTWFDDGVVHYEWQDVHHHHITCNRCGYREPIEICPRIDSRVLDNSKRFSIINNHVLELFSICSVCK
jgi:Fe2+ or Zn2+ uptake regulation protein